jgi:chemotaxis receptor (MCP) glutamine deamidase CheD
MRTNSQFCVTQTLLLGPGEYYLGPDAGLRLQSLDVRSSVLLAAWVPGLLLGGCLRFAYPSTSAAPAQPYSRPYLCAETAVPAFLAMLRESGAPASGIQLYAAGASQIPEERHAPLSGKANELALKRILWREKLYLAGEDFGGSTARSVYFEPAAGRFLVSYTRPRVPAAFEELRHAV